MDTVMDPQINFKIFFKGFLSAVIGGVANTLAAQSQSSGQMDMDHLSKAAMTGAVLGGVMYLVGHVHGQVVGVATGQGQMAAAAGDQVEENQKQPGERGQKGQGRSQWQ